MTAVLGSEHVCGCRHTLTIQDLLPTFSGWWNCLGGHLVDLWPTSSLKSYLRVWQVQSTKRIAGLWHADQTCAEFLSWLRAFTWGKNSGWMVVWGLNTDWIFCAGHKPSWLGRGGLWGHVGWDIVRAQEDAVHMGSLILSGDLRTVAYFPRGAYPDGAPHPEDGGGMLLQNISMSAYKIKNTLI